MCDAELSSRWDTQHWASLQHALLRGPPPVSSAQTPLNSGLSRESQDAPPHAFKSSPSQGQQDLSTFCHDGLVPTFALNENGVDLPPRLQQPQSGKLPRQVVKQRDQHESESACSTKLTMDRPEDTQLMDTQVWVDMGYSRAAVNTSDTGDAGHVDLLHAENKSTADTQNTFADDDDDDDDEDLEDDIGTDQPTVTQLLQPETVTSPAAFSPTTPGVFAGNRSMRPVDLPSSTSRTPAPNLAGMFKTAGDVMGLTQLFGQTQARSSPGPGEAPSDGILERPSPAFQHPDRAFSDSPVAVRTSSDATTRTRRATSTAGPQEPKDYYISLKESQELRARRKMQQNLTSSPDAEEAEDFLNDPERHRAEKRRRLAVRQDRARQELKNIATPMLGSTSARKRRKLGPAATVIGIITPASRRKDYVNLVSDFPTDTVPGPASSDEENDYFDELSQEVIPRSSPRLHSKTPATSKKSLQQVPISSTTSTMKLALNPNHNNSLEAQPHSDTGRQVIATQLDKGFSPARSPAQASEAEKIADSQPTRDNESNTLGTTVLRPSPQSQRRSRGPDVTSLLSDMHERLPNTGRSQTSSAGPGPPKDLESEDDSHSADLSQSSSQPTELPSSPPPTEAALATEQPVRTESSSRKILSPRSAPSSLKRKRTAASGPDLTGSNPSSEPSQTFRVRNRLNYAVPDTSPAVPAPTVHNTSSAPESMPPRHHTRTNQLASTSLSQGHSANTHYQTAREAQLFSPSKTKSRQPSGRSSGQNSQAAKIRSMGDFENSKSPDNVSGSLDIGLDVMDEDDIAFTVTTRTPERRRSRKLYHTKKIPMTRDNVQGQNAGVQQEVQDASLPTEDPANHQDQDSIGDDIFETSTPLAAAKKKPVGSLKRIRSSKAKPVQSNQNKDEPTKPMKSNAGLDAAQPENYSVPDDDTIQTRVMSPTVAVTEKTVSHDDRTHQEATDKVNPYRVYAAFKGEYDFYYPGTCIGVSGSRGHQSYQIKFDDGGDVIAKDMSVIRRLELRIGDMVKVSIKRIEHCTWVVRGFSDPVPRSSRSIAEEAPHTDVYGHANVILEAVRKPRAKTKSSNRTQQLETEIVPVELTYITHDQWYQFDDRLFRFTPQGLLDIARAGSHPQTPSIASLPNSPSSRKRRQTIAASEKTSLGNQHVIAPPSENSTGIFSNMAFAISYSVEADKTSIARTILQNGGTVLRSGFDELFDTPFLPDVNERPAGHDARSASVGNLRLTASASALGFVALIADKHSRREKYIQALALNIPCLHGRWVSDSIATSSVMPWLRYLLPAGESACFDNAVRNRVMPPMPEATECRLSETIAARPAFLDSTNVLLIMGKGKAEERRRTHLFLTCALGARAVLRVRDVDAAKAALQDARQTWDWVYVEELAKEAVKAELLGTAATGESSRGKTKGKTSSSRRQSARKSTDGAGSAGAVADAKFKVVGDEFVIQSLIWGALIPGES